MVTAIVTVGTSVIKGSNPEFPGFNLWYRGENNGKNPESFEAAILRAYANTGYWKTASAEWSALRLLDALPKHVVLIHGSDVDAKVAPRILKLAFKSEGVEVTSLMARGLGRNMKALEQKGLPNLLKVVGRAIREATERDGTPPIVIPQGGLKVMGSYAQILAFLSDCDAYYTYENTKVLVALPGLPLGVDPDRASAQVRGLADDDPVRLVVEQAAERQRNPQPVLSTKRFKISPEVAEIGKELATLAKVWSGTELWHADVIPQMVGHGISHAKVVEGHASELGLMAGFPARILLGLVAAAWLHDIGHAGYMLGSEAGGRQFVNNYHHVRKTHGLLSEEWIRDEGDRLLPIIGDEERTIIALLAGHHQRYRRISHPEAKAFECCGAGCKIETAVARDYTNRSLEDRLEDLGLPPDEIPIWLQAAAVLRVADAADLGKHRVGGRHIDEGGMWERQWRRAAVEELRVSVDLAKEAEADMGQAGEFATAEKFLAQCLRHAELVRSAPAFDALLKPEIRRAFTAIGLAVGLKGLSDRLAFLDVQAGHVRLHAAFEYSAIETDKDGIWIVLQGNTYSEKEQGYAGTYILEEYDGVADLMESAGLRIVGVRVRGPFAQDHRFDEMRKHQAAGSGIRRV